MSWDSHVDNSKKVYRVQVNQSLDQFTSDQYDDYLTEFATVKANLNNGRYYGNSSPMSFKEWAESKIQYARSIGLCLRMWNTKGVATTYARKAKKQGVDAWVEEGTISWERV